MSKRVVLVLAWALFALVASPCRADEAVPIAAGPLLSAEPIHFQFAVYYSAPPSKDPMALLRERVGRTGGLQLVPSLPSKPAGAVLMARLSTTVRSDYRPPDLQLLLRFGRGLTRAQAEALQGARQALILDFAHPASLAGKALLAASQIAEQLARGTDGLLWDEETREVFTPDEWRKHRIDTWAGTTPDVTGHTVIHAYKSEQLVRAITLGMAKFGLPDVVVNDFPWSLNSPVGNIINVFCQAMVEGATVTTRGEYDLDLRSIRSAAVRESQLGTLKTNAAAVARLSLVKGKWESGDPRNRLVDIGFDRYPGPDRYARQNTMLSAMFGTEDSVTRVRHTEELLALSKAANARLPALREAFNRGLQPGEYIEVKAPFPILGGGNEWMWVEVTSWSADAIGGLLKNEPANIPALHGGQTVKVSQAAIFDYIRRYPGGREEGNETGKLLMRMQTKGK